eukprot:3113818-Lingulodinium_polyedra.AAC.1
MEEVELAFGGKGATAVLDLKKAYELVAWPQLAAEAVGVEFPGLVLAMSLRMFGAPRLVQFCGSASECCQ